jgi:hypothetical protein
VSVVPGKWKEGEFDHFLSESVKIKDAGSRINFISGRFLNTAYRESTLIGDKNTPEVFVINLEGVDCFTFIDYIEAMRLSGSFSEFRENVKKVRYREGKVAFENRNHFFTDWRESNSAIVDDVTVKVGDQKTERVTKILNKKEDGTHLLPGIRPVQREIEYIPSVAVDDTVFNELKTGDYAGIYSGIMGLDVSHVGIIIRDGNSIIFRHASAGTNHRKVVDQVFKVYLADKPGLIVLRPKNVA